MKSYVTSFIKPSHVCTEKVYHNINVWSTYIGIQLGTHDGMVISRVWFELEVTLGFKEMKLIWLPLWRSGMPRCDARGVGSIAKHIMFTWLRHSEFSCGALCVCLLSSMFYIILTVIITFSHADYIFRRYSNTWFVYNRKSII